MDGILIEKVQAAALDFARLSIFVISLQPVLPVDVQHRMVHHGIDELIVDSIPIAHAYITAFR